MIHSISSLPELFRYRHDPDLCARHANGTTDSSHLARYFALMEKCRDDAFEELLPDAGRYLQLGFGLITKFARIDLANELGFLDQMLVRMECLSLRRTQMELGFEFVRESDGFLLCTGRNAVVWVNAQRHPAIMPEELYNNMALRSVLADR